MSTRRFITEAQANQVAARGENMAVKVGEKWLEIPKMPPAYRNKQGRVVRANMRMHINNHISNMGLIPCELPNKNTAAKGEAKAKEPDLLSPDMIEKLQKAVAEGVDLESESLKDISEFVGMKVSGAQRDQFLSLAL